MLLVAQQHTLSAQKQYEAHAQRRGPASKEANRHTDGARPTQPGEREHEPVHQGEAADEAKRAFIESGSSGVLPGED